MLVIYDGDYSTATAQIAEFDPLIKFMINQNVINLWIMCQIFGILSDVGVQLGERRGHRYVAAGDAAYFLTVIDRGAARMVEDGLLYSDTAMALKSEAKRRVTRGTFFGFMSYVSQIASKN